MTMIGVAITEEGEDGGSSSIQQNDNDTKDAAIEAINHDSIEAEVAVAGTNIIVLWLFLLCMATLLYQFYYHKRNNNTLSSKKTNARSSDTTPEVEMKELDAYTDW
jgi:Na+/alanine symporter